MESKQRTRRDFLKGTAVAVGAAVLTACAPSSQPAGETAGSGEDMPATEEISIRFAMWDWYANTPGVRWDEWNQTEAFPIFEEENPGTKLEWEPLGSGWPDKILTQMAAGTAPDIISTWSPHIDTWAEKHQLLDLQPLLTRYRSVVGTCDLLARQIVQFCAQFLCQPPRVGEYDGRLVALDELEDLRVDRRPDRAVSDIGRVAVEGIRG